MGYTTEFSGEVAVTPPLNEHEVSFLKDFNQTRRMHRSGGPLFVKGEGPYGQGHGPDTIHDSNRPDEDQPGLWCQWVPTDDGIEIVWDEGEKFYCATEWMEYIVNKLLSPDARPYVDAHLKEDERLKHFTCDHRVDGVIYADGEDTDDHWKLVVSNNQVGEVGGEFVFADELEEAKPPTVEELNAALRSLGAPTTMTVYSLTVDDSGGSIVTQVFSTPQGPYESLKANYDDENKFDVSTAKGCGDLVEELTERQGIVLYIDEHELEVPA